MNKMERIIELASKISNAEKEIEACRKELQDLVVGNPDKSDPSLTEVAKRSILLSTKKATRSSSKRKYDHERYVQRRKRQKLSNAMRKRWSEMTPEEREARVKKLRSGLKRLKVQNMESQEKLHV